MNSKRITASFAFKFFERIAVKGVGLIISIVLARLIAPEVYGLLAIVMVFVNLAQTFAESGLAIALVQDQNTSEDDYSTVFYMSLVLAIIEIIVLYIAAPVIARMYKNDVLIWPIRVSTFSLLVGALNSVQTAKMQREMRFCEMMICNLIAAVISGAVGIYAAALGAGLWALIIHHMINVVAATITMSFAGRWYPKLRFSVSRAKTLYRYGSKLMFSGLLTSFYNEIRTLIIGYKYSNTDLAYYNRGYQFPNIIANILDVSVQSVMLPVMSREQDRKEALRSMLLQTISISVFFVTPIMFGLAAVGSTLIPLLLGEVWRPCVPLLGVFCLGELMLPIQSSNLSLIKAIGRSDLYMRTEMMRRIMMVTILSVTVICFDNVFAIVCGYALSAWIDIYIIAKAVEPHIDCKITQQISVIWKSLLGGAIMFCVVYMMNGLAIHPIAILGLQVLIGVIVYIAVSFVIRNDTWLYIKDKISEYIVRRT